MNPCLHLTPRLMLSGASSGVGLWCAECERWVTVELGHHTSWALPKGHPMLEGVNRVELGRVHAVSVACEICLCETQTPELHHWCPRALYRDDIPPNAGPQAWLCKPCHATWHEIVTPGLVGGMTFETTMRFLRSLYKRLGRSGWAQFVRVVNDADAALHARRPVPPQPSRQEAA